MEIKNSPISTSINFQANKPSDENIKPTMDSENSTIEASADDILASQNRASINVFKCKRQVKEKIENLPEDIKGKFDLVEITITNARFMDKIVSDENLCKKMDEVQLRALAGETDDISSARAGIAVIDWLKSEELLDNENVAKKLLPIIIRRYENGNLSHQKYVTDTLKSSEELRTNQNVTANLGSILASISNKSQRPILDRIFSDEKYYNNETFMNNVGNLLSMVRSPEKAKIADKILSDEKYYNNETLMNHIHCFDATYDFSKGIIKLEDEILKHEQLFSNPEFLEKIGEEIHYKAQHKPAEISAKRKMIETLDKYGLLDNESVVKEAPEIISQTSTRIERMAKSGMAKKLCSDERILKNQNISDMAGDIIKLTDSIRTLNARTDMVDTLLEHNFMDSNKVEENAGNIINSVSNKYQVAMAEAVLFNPELRENESIMSQLDYMMAFTQNSENLESQIAIKDYILDNDLLENKVVAEHAANIIGGVRDSESLDMAKRILSDEKLSTNEAIMQNARRLLLNCYVPEAKEILDRVSSGDESYDSSSIEEDIDGLFDEDCFAGMGEYDSYMDEDYEYPDDETSSEND